MAVDRLLDDVKHATIATVSPQGQPWNTPVYFARVGSSFFWISRADAQHSINIRENGRAFIVIYDSSRDDTSGAALYVDTDACELTEEPFIARAMTTIYRRRQKSSPSVASFQSPAVQRIYVAVGRQAWTNVVHVDGECPWDERVAVALDE